MTFPDAFSNVSRSGLSIVAYPNIFCRSSLLKEMAEKDMTTGFGREKLTVMERGVSILEDIIYNGELSNTLIDPDMWSVIEEETAPYFAGDKSAEDVVHIIQGRIKIILAE